VKDALNASVHRDSVAQRLQDVLVAELTMGEGGKQLSQHDRDVADGRCHAVQDRLHRAEGSCQFAFREADPRSIPSALSASGESPGFGDDLSPD
jgi:hypothetical protein